MAEAAIQTETDENEAVLNKRWLAFIESFKFWQKFLLATANVNLTYDETIDFDAPTPKGQLIPNDHNSFVFLAKHITRIDVLNSEGQALSESEAITKGKKAVVHMSHLQLTHEAIPLPNGKTSNVFCVSNLKMDYLVPDDKQAKFALQEAALACWTVVHAAKAAGLSPVDAGNTTDPVLRYMIRDICGMLKIECNEPKPLSMPYNESLGGDLTTACNMALEKILNDPNLPTLIDDKPTEPATRPEAAPVMDTVDDIRAKLNKRNRRRGLTAEAA